MVILDKPYVNGVTFREQEIFLKYCQPFEHLIFILGWIRSFNRGKIGSVHISKVQEGSSILRICFALSKGLVSKRM